MREIKFRAWDKQDNRMIIDQQDFIPLKITNCGVFRLDAKIKDDRWILISNDRFEIEQFTGMRDKNSKEIYEGDIVKSFVYGNPFISEVTFNNAQFCIDCCSERCAEAMQESEIMGNVHENPELLA